MSGTAPIRGEDGVEEIDEEAAGGNGGVEPYDPAKIKIDTDKVSLDILLRRLEHGELLPGPSSPGRGLWSPIQRSRLIESLLLRIPLPAFYFDGTDDDRWLVVDGRQRLNALHSFILEADPEQRLRLTGLQYLRQLEGQTYDVLPRPMQRRIDETQVTVHIIRPGTPPEVRYNLFRRINTGGHGLTAQEIRHILFPGPAVEFLDRLAQSESFLIATNGDIPSHRMLDRELVLRFCAFTLTPPPSYAHNDLDRFLTEAMEILNKATEERRSNLETRFDQAMRMAWRIFRKDAFRKRFDTRADRHPLNEALFEAWSVLLGWLAPEEVEATLKARETLLQGQMKLMSEDAFFLESISQGTGETAKVTHRFWKIASLINQGRAEVARA